MPRPQPAASSEPAPNRRQAILLAAEQLFAERGYHAVSIRDIASAAGVPLALVGYYWGAKHELYHAIFETWQPSISERLARLQAVMATADEPGALERLLTAFIDPLVALHADPAGRHYAQMAARDLAAPTVESERAAVEFFDPMAHAYLDALQQLYPQRSRGDLAWCYQFMLGAVLHFLSDRRVERLSRGENQASDPAQQARLIQFVAAGFRALLDPPARTTARTNARRKP
ncbi:MAG: TetR family transcriptional regulator [Rubrivivax sp.]|nr:TetR family transcriptional regulator [Rubrivivax sp.]